jgi:hypothetical protein
MRTLRRRPFLSMAAALKNPARLAAEKRSEALAAGCSIVR